MRIVISTLEWCPSYDSTILTFTDKLFFVVCSKEKIIFISKRNGANEDVKEECLEL